MHFQLTVRGATRADTPDILAITREAFAKYAYDLDGDHGRVKALHETEDGILQDMQSKYVLVGEIDGVPAGSIRYEFLPSGIGYISRFGVKLTAQSRGMGGALVSAVVSACSEVGMNAVALHTCAKMFSLIRFYYGKGFYIHSTATDRGYLRALLVKELQFSGPIVNYRNMVPESY